MTKIAGSGTISQKHGFEDPDPDPPQNVMDPEHCGKPLALVLYLIRWWCWRRLPRWAGQSQAPASPATGTPPHPRPTGTGLENKLNNSFRGQQLSRSGMIWLMGGCMPRLFIIKKTWLSAFRYAQSRTSLVFCRSLGFPAKSDLADFCALCKGRRCGRGDLPPY